VDSTNQRLVRLRKARGFTMKQMAAKIEVPLSTYRDWEYGRANQGTPYIKLAAALGVSLYELLSGEKPHYRHIFNLLESAKVSLQRAQEELGPLL